MVLLKRDRKSTITYLYVQPGKSDTKSTAANVDK